MKVYFVFVMVDHKLEYVRGAAVFVRGRIPHRVNFEERLW